MNPLKNPELWPVYISVATQALKTIKNVPVDSYNAPHFLVMSTLVFLVIAHISNGTITDPDIIDNLIKEMAVMMGAIALIYEYGYKYIIVRAYTYIKYLIRYFW